MKKKLVLHVLHLLSSDRKKIRTDMPDNLKDSVENISGIDVRVHYNSSKPAEVGALAYNSRGRVFM